MLLTAWFLASVLIVMWIGGATHYLSVLDVLGSYDPVHEAEAILEEDW